MRPLSLKMTAFGPFSTTEFIDFSALGDNPLFLINGPTGSGKTTILDAICFALYGKTTGDERDGAQMRCDLAAADLLCEVTFKFELNGRVYQICRIPEQQRPKARGAGLTEQKPEAQLIELSSNGGEVLHVATKVSDATRQIEILTGLSVDQFRQVMILPQGKFRQLLLAESAEREKIFSKLFQTQIYKQLESRLKEQAAQVRREREDLRQQQLGVLDTIEVESVEQLELEIKELRPRVVEFLAAKQQAEAHFVDANNALQQGRSLEEEFNRLDKINAELQQLKKQREQIEQQRHQLVDALAAEQLRSVFADRQRCHDAVQIAEKKQCELLAQLKDSEEKLQLAQQQMLQIEGLDRERDRCKVELAQLGEQKEKVLRVEGLRRQSDNLQQRITAFAQLGQLGEKEQQLEQIKSLEELSDGLLQLDQQLEGEKQAGLELSQRRELQIKSCRKLELDWHRGQAAILAAELENNQPCPVCGSHDHPAPAYSDVVLPSQHDIELSRAELQEMTTQLEAARDRYRQTASSRDLLQLRFDELQKQIDPSLHRAELESAVSSLHQLVVSSDLPAEVSDLPATELDKKQIEVQQELTAVKTEIALLEKGLPEESRQLESLEQREKGLQKQLTNLENQHKALLTTQQQAKQHHERVAATLDEVARQLKELQTQLNSATIAAEKSLSGSRFADEESYHQALCDESQRQQWQGEIEEYTSELQKLTGAHDQLQLSLVAKARPDLDKLQAKLLSSEGKKNRIEGEWKQYDSRLQNLFATEKKLARNQQQLTKLDEQYAVIGTLSDVANGQTGQKVSLQRFVLSVLLDEVLLEASHRFSLMSKGRYQLLRNEDRSKGNKASGLDLLVDDAYTGKVRSVATLSGGESFMAALSLALGLSDVVQAHAGGIHLDTLFIDEGFGSLDPESLDLAIRTLVDLQSSGRMIGVISHVAELKEQIPLRIEVTAGRLGSSVKCAG